MLDFNIKRSYLKKDHAEVFYQLYLGDVTTEDEYNAETEKDEPVTRFRRTQVVGEEQKIAFTRQDAFDIATQMGATTEADVLASQTLEGIGAGFMSLLDAYLRVQLVETATQMGTTVYQPE